MIEAKTLGFAFLAVDIHSLLCLCTDGSSLSLSLFFTLSSSLSSCLRLLSHLASLVLSRLVSSSLSSFCACLLSLIVRGFSDGQCGLVVRPMGAVRKMGSQSRTDSDWRKAKAAAKAAFASASTSIPVSASAKAADPPPPGFYKSFASFIFVCNNSTIPDLDRRIFGLPAKYIDSVRAIRKGMPLFLYNYSTRFLHGLFEATSDGGYNLDPHAWENTDATSNGRPPMSRYPAQVRVRVVDKMLLPLQLDRFNPVLDHEEDGKFKLELTHHQVQRLLRLFDASNANNWTGDGSTYVVPLSREPTSPNYICTNDSDSCSVSSSKGTNTQDEEEEEEEEGWRKEFRLLNGHVPGDCLEEEEVVLSLSERVTKVALKEKYGPSNSTRVPVEANGMKKRGNQQGGGGGGGRSGVLSSSSEHSENSMLSRLWDLPDPAVNSGRLFSLAQSQLHDEGGEEHTLPVPVPLAASTHPHSHRGVSKWTTTSTSTSSTTTPKPSPAGTWSRWNPRRHAPLANQETKAKHVVPEKDDGDNNSTPPLHEVGGTLSMSPLPPSPSPPLSLPPPSSEWGLQVPVLLMHPIVKDARENIPLNAALHREILQFAKLARPSHHARLQAEAAIHCIRSVVKWVWPEADVEVFGSFATGLCLRHSDVDLAVVGAPLPHEVLSVGQASSCLIRELASTLEGSKWCESINVLDTASMPVLKCHCRPTTLHSESLSLPSIAVDITIGVMRKATVEAGMDESTSTASGLAAKIIELSSKHTGGLAREYVLQKIRDLPALAPLALLLKSYLHHRGLNNVYYGGLGSFSLTLLLAFFLERVPIHFEASPNGMWAESSALSPPSCSPLVSSEDFNVGGSSSSSCDLNLDANGDHFLRKAAGVMDRVLKLWETRGAPYLGILLMGFLQTFGFQVDLATVKIVLKGADENPSGIFERDHDERHIALWIDDPLRPGVNVGAGSFGMFHVQAAFRDMLEVFKNPHLSILPSPNSKSICSDIPNDWYYLNRIFVDSEDYCSQSSP